jgi:hypothetical protein
MTFGIVSVSSLIAVDGELDASEEEEAIGVSSVSSLRLDSLDFTTSPEGTSSFFSVECIAVPEITLLFGIDRGAKCSSSVTSGSPLSFSYSSLERFPDLFGTVGEHTATSMSPR